MSPLSPKRRSELRAEAHTLTPVVIIGDKGLTEEVVAEVDRSLTAHELIKVRATTDDRKARDAWLASLSERLAAHPVQQIGKVFVLYRENPEKTAKAKRAAAAAARPSSASRRQARRRRQTYFTSTISNSFTPPGVRTSATSPALFPMRALAIGLE